MKATKRIRKLLRDLQALADPSSAEAEEGQVHEELLTTTSSDILEDKISSLGQVDDSKSSPVESSTDFGTDITSTPSESYASKILQDEVERLVQELGRSRVLVATLEAEIKMLKHENEQQQSQDHALIQRLEAELKHLQQQTQTELAALQSRQQQIELDLPNTEQQLCSLKEVLHDLNVSEPLYAELVAVPKAKRSVKAHIQILAYEKMRTFREEMESLRQERDTSRESLARQNDEVERMQREVQRVTAAATVEKREIEKEIGAVAARNERLQDELKEALVKVEVLSAKEAMYDEVKEKLDKAEISIVNGDNQKAVMAATLQVVTDEKQRLLQVIRDKDHCLDLLSMDKIYLTREIKAYQDQVKKLEQEQQQQQEKLRALKNTRQELYNRVLSDNRDSLAAHEQRLQAEIARVQEQANRETERVTKETTEVAEEKVKTFRELRDAALAEAERLKAIQRDNKSDYDELLTRFQELQRVSEAKEIEARSGIKLRNFELEQLRVAQQEIRCGLNQKSIENEALAEKVKILTEKYHKREMEMERSAAILRNELDMTRRNLAHYETQDLHQHNPHKENILSEDTCSRCKKRSITVSKGAKMRNDGLLVLRNTSAQTSGRVTPRANACFTEQNDTKLQKVIQDSDTLPRQGFFHPKANTSDFEKRNEKGDVPAGHKAMILRSSPNIQNARTESDHMCHRLHSLQLDLRKILETRGTLDSFQNLLREKGIHISDNVIKKISRAKKVGG